MTGMAAVAFCGMMTGCSNEMEGALTVEESVTKIYEDAFIQRFGQPADDLDWGFHNVEATSQARATTRSEASPSVPNINAPYNAAWVSNYLTTATEPNSQNVTDNFDNSTYATNYGEGGVNSIDWNDAAQTADRDYFFSLSWDEAVTWALANHPTWVTYTADETFVRNFKITGTYSGGIGVAATEGLTDGVENGNQRTIVVTGTWNITEDQRIGSLGKIIIASGGTVNVASGATLQMVNQARLVVLSGGTLTGNGEVEVSNGNASGYENYNAGTISVAKFNNNFGKFYNYGRFLVTEYNGGSQESNFYNHNLASIDHFAGSGSTANARVFNKCQFYVKNDARIRNYEGVNGSALIVGGQLMFSGSEDGTTTSSYVGLAAGALVKCGTLYNNSTSWTGPTSGYAVLTTGMITYLNWTQDHPEQSGYFQNNIYVEIKDATNIPSGNGYQAGETATADYKFFHIVANAKGNGNVTKVKAGSNEILPADNDFVLGNSGCTPGYNGDVVPDDDDNGDDGDDGDDDDEDDDDEDDETPVIPTNAVCRIIAEDLTVDENSDFDFNDVVFDVAPNGDGTTTIILRAAGGTLPLYVAGHEVHQEFANAYPNKGITTMTMINTRGFTVDPVSFTISGSYDRATSINIPITVTKNGTSVTLTANKGKTASKVAVGTDYEWCNERQDIDNKYHKRNGYRLFTGYVRGEVGDNWYKLVNE